MSDEIYRNVFTVFAFIFGAIVGSFLNVCVYRMPRGISVNNPRRSFCPKCNKQIPWYQNLPILSWILLRGKCSSCKSPIPPRYLLLEALTGALFVAVWLTYPWIVAIPMWIFVSILIVATFIDFEHYIIPDEITWGGTIAGILLSLAIPVIHGQTNPIAGLGWSVLGAAVGYASLYAVVKLGKMAFGRKAQKYSEPVPLTWVGIGTPPEKDANLTLGDRTQLWSDFFVEKERVEVDCAEFDIDGKTFKDVVVVMTNEEVEVAGTKYGLDRVDKMTGLVRSIAYSREAMGFGDVKFIAAIGAFLGWKGVFFTIFAGSVAGSIVGMISILFNRRDWSGKVPFGPYLSLGALVWLFCGERLTNWYFNWLRVSM